MSTKNDSEKDLSVYMVKYNLWFYWDIKVGT